MKAMILAAGYGKRLRPLTDHTPKPLVSVGGKPLLVHHLEKIAGAGIKDVVINLGHLGAKIPELLGNGDMWNLNIKYSDEGPDPLETGGGMAKALPILGEDTFMLINGDVWCDLDFRQIPQSLKGRDQAMLFMAKQPAWRSRGDFELYENRVRESENPSLLYTGIALYHPSILEGAKVEKFSIVPRLKKAIRQDRVAGEIVKGEWDDVGTPERLAAPREKHGG